MDWTGEEEMTAVKGLNLANLSVRFNGLYALTDINLTVAPRTIVGLIGPNGSGKTTLVNAITGFQSVFSGEVQLNGERIDGKRPHIVARMGIARTYQAGRLFSQLTVLENIAIPAISKGHSVQKAKMLAQELMDWLDISALQNSEASALPYTDQRRVSIARALALTPQYICLDEPAAGMTDEEWRELLTVICLIPNYHSCGVLLIEHNMDVVMGACDHIHVLNSGRSIASGSPEEIKLNRTVIDAYLGRNGDDANAA